MQRDKGRDLFDLAHALDVFEGLNTGNVVGFFRQYLERSGLRISRAEAERRMFAELNDPGFLAEMRPLLAAAQAEGLTHETMKAGFSKVFSQFVVLLPGEPWARSEDMKERFQVLR